MTNIDYRDPEWVAEKLGVDKNTVYKFLQEGKIPAVQLGRKWLISEKLLAEWLESEARAQTLARRQSSASIGRTLRQMDNFSDRAREAIRIAHTQARQLCHGRIGQEHLLLGLLSVDQSRASALLGEAGVNIDQVRKRIEEGCPPGDTPPARRLGRTPDAKEAMHAAAREARRRGSEVTRTEHMLLGLLLVSGKSCEILTDMGLTAEHVAEAINAGKAETHGT